MGEKKGILLVLLTAIISGASIFTNSFAVKESNAFVFTFLKNAAVAAFLFALILLLKELPTIKSLSKKQWATLSAIGLIGGCIPFLLFFYALQFTTAINAGFLHKTIFIWAALFAVIFLKEKPGKRFLGAAALLLLGNFLLFKISSFGIPEMLILLAAIIWAAENALSKNALKELSGSIVAFGRMAFGSIFTLAFLLLSGNFEPMLSLSQTQIAWAIIASGFLFAFVFTFYSGLKYLPLHKATALLLIAQPITAILSLAFSGKAISMEQAFGILLIICGILLAAGFGFLLQKAKTKVPSIAAERN